jgi:hypothetical protein
LNVPRTHAEKSGVARFAFRDSEVTVIRRVVVTSLDGIAAPERVSEIILRKDAIGYSIALSSRGFTTIRGGKLAGMVLDDVDQKLFASIDELMLLPQNDRVLSNEPPSVVAIVNLLESDHRDRWLLLLGPGSREQIDPDEVNRLSRSLGVIADVLEVHVDILADLNDELGLAYSIPRDGFRIFAPGFDLENDLDARRHPSIATIPVESQSTSLDYTDDKIQQIAAICISTSQQFASPYGDSELQDEILQQFLAVEVSNIRANNKELLDRETVDVGDLRSRIDDLASQLEFANEYGAHWEGQYTSADAELSETHLDLYVTNSELDDERRANAYLRKLLAEQEIYDAGNGPAGDIWADVPNTFVELVGRCSELPFLRFTGSMDPIRQLDAQPRMGVAVSRAWESLHALSDYARLKQSKEFSGGLHEYMKTGIHSGYKIGPNALAMSEGEQVNVNPAFRESRTFEVPEEVSGGGGAFMEAHIKLVTGSANSPRMHFLDNTGGDDLVYVGYIGRHLPSPQTN